VSGRARGASAKDRTICPNNGLARNNGKDCQLILTRLQSDSITGAAAFRSVDASIKLNWSEIGRKRCEGRDTADGMMEHAGGRSTGYRLV